MHIDGGGLRNQAALDVADSEGLESHGVEMECPELWLRVVRDEVYDPCEQVRRALALTGRERCAGLFQRSAAPSQEGCAMGALGHGAGYHDRQGRADTDGL